MVLEIEEKHKKGTNYTIYRDKTFKSIVMRISMKYSNIWIRIKIITSIKLLNEFDHLFSAIYLCHSLLYLYLYLYLYLCVFMCICIGSSHIFIYGYIIRIGIVIFEDDLLEVLGGCQQGHGQGGFFVWV